MKRRIDEEPLNAFILNCKRPRYDETEASNVPSNLPIVQETSTIVKFAGTVSSQVSLIELFVLFKLCSYIFVISFKHCKYCW